MTRKKRTFATAIAAMALSGVSLADSTNARCDIYEAGSDHTDKMLHCTFSQRLGFITIAREDGVVHELYPAPGQPGVYSDENGNRVNREFGLGDQGLVFRFPAESVFVYWSTSAFESPDEDSPTWPFSTEDYDATTLLRCRAIDEIEFDRCPAGILRMEDRQASIVVQGRAGAQFTINFMRDYINASNREIEATLTDDTWLVVVDRAEVYEVPLAAIEGG